ncbi:hypothetical protein ACUVJI_20455 [Vibrio parahaemolyticus]|uniref:hypothetical protein n=1 Tax=Vibrio parahaemolyticus TaxID=670 RepID=UPI001D79B2AA|nr:hypothetical protein [Vibrio parahaemolyticus]ELI5414741.1 hypothetical protein [Vibrio parahaemolyticus]ELI5423321.1 hypothetical protein [Vibrio parahaemolyticus]MCI9685722.1 hypothetical protein [Vibrio parahaemolyticus]
MVDKNDTVTHNERNKKLLSLASIIFLGALGSGFWDLFLKDFLFFILRWSTDIADTLFNGFADSFYSDVGKATNPVLTVLGPFFVVVAIVGYMWVATVIYFTKTSASNYRHTSSRRARKRSTVMSIFYPSAALFITFTYGHAFVTDVYNYKISNYLDRTIEILRPKISEEKHIELRALFRQIETRNQFQSLYFELNRLGSNNGVDLPDIEPLMVESNSPSKS